MKFIIKVRVEWAQQRKINEIYFYLTKRRKLRPLAANQPIHQLISFFLTALQRADKRKRELVELTAAGQPPWPSVQSTQPAPLHFIFNETAALRRDWLISLPFLYLRCLFDWIVWFVVWFASLGGAIAGRPATNPPNSTNTNQTQLHQTPMEQQLHQSSIIDDWRAGLFPWGPAAPRREIKINLFFPLGREEKLIVWFHFSRGHSSNIFII